MVDFRKWLFALAVVGLLLGIGSSAANAQGTLNCTTTAGGGVNVNIRAEGVTELVGDLIINCSGGTTDDRWHRYTAGKHPDYHQHQHHQPN